MNKQEEKEANYYAVARQIFDFFVALKFPKFQAAAIVENAAAETSLNTEAVGDNKKSIGLFQWHHDRVMLIYKGNKQYPGCGILLTKDSSVSENLECLWFELRTFEKHALNRFRATTSAYDAGFAFASLFERVGKKGQPKARGTGSQKWLNYFEGHSDKAGEYHTDKLEDEDKMHKESVVAKESYDDQDMHRANVADSWNHNVANPNFYDKELAKEPDETTYFDAHGNKYGHVDDKVKFEDVYVEHPETVNTATSVISTKTLDGYANASTANTIPHHSNRTRGVNDPRRDDFTTELSNKSEKTMEADAIASGRSKDEQKSLVEGERHTEFDYKKDEADSEVKEKGVKADKKLDKANEAKEEEKRGKKEEKDAEKHHKTHGVDDEHPSKKLTKEERNKEVANDGKQLHQPMGLFDYHDKKDEVDDKLETNETNDKEHDRKELEEKQHTPGSHYSDEFECEKKTRGRPKKDKEANLSDHFKETFGHHEHEEHKSEHHHKKDEKKD